MTAPLTPADCDLTDFPFMPLEVSRLRRSKAWLICKRNPALAFYMLNLWTACWHERPAGSLEDDDDVLADLAMCDPAKWDKVKADVLRGWVMCDDGRYYHPTVCQKVVEAWNAKLDQRWRTECARIKKHADRHEIKLPRPSFEAWVEAGCPQGQRLPVPEDTGGTGIGQGRETHSKGEGEGQGEGERDSSSEAKASAAAGASAPVDKSTNPESQPIDRRVVWESARDLLVAANIAEVSAREFIGSLVSDFTLPIAAKAVESAVKAKPFDPKAYLLSTCKALKASPNGSQYESAEATRTRLDAEAKRTVLGPEEVAELRRQREAVKAAGQQQQPGEAA